MLILTCRREGVLPVQKPKKEKFNSRSDIYSSQYESFNNYKSLLENSNYMMTPSDLGAAGDKYARGGIFGSSLSPEQMGYSRFRVPDPEGEGTVIRYIYTGSLYKYKQSDAAWILYKWLYGLLSFVIIALSIVTITFNSNFSQILLVSIPEFLAMLAACYLTHRCFLNITCRRSMVLYKYSKAVVDFRVSIAIDLVINAVLLFAMGTSIDFAGLSGINEIHFYMRVAVFILALLLLVFELVRKCVPIENNYQLPYGAEPLD